MAGAGHLHKRRALQVPNAPQKADRTGVGLQTGENRWVRTFIPNFIVRLKNRKGRSFLASISREAFEQNGKTIYQNTFQKLSDALENDNEETFMVEEPLYETVRTIAL